MSPLPWGEDDCNIFSRPFDDIRHAAIRAKLDKQPYDESALHLDAFVASTQQHGEHSDDDAVSIVAIVNAAPALIAEVRRLRIHARQFGSGLPKPTFLHIDDQISFEWVDDLGSVSFTVWPDGDMLVCETPREGEQRCVETFAEAPAALAEALGRRSALAAPTSSTTAVGEAQKAPRLRAFITRLDDIMCGLIEGASREETKDALYTYVADNLWSIRDAR